MGLSLHGVLVGTVVALAQGAGAQPPRAVVLPGDAVPGVPGLVSGGGIGLPVINGAGNVAVLAFFTGSVVSGVLSEVGGLHAVARTGDVAPGSGGLTFEAFGSRPISLADNGLVSFVNSVTLLHYGVWSEFLGGLNVVALDMMPAPCSPPGTYILGSPPLFSASATDRLVYKCRFDATGTGFTYDAVFSGAPGSVGMHARQDSPPSPDGFVSFGLPLINNAGVVCVHAQFIGGGLRTGIFTGASSSLFATATSNSPAPDPNGNPLPGDERFLQFFGYSLNDANAVAFAAGLTGAFAWPSGIFEFDVQGQREVGLVNDQAPGEPPGVVFQVLGTPYMCDTGDVIFMAQLRGPGVTSSNDTAIYRYRGHTLFTVARAGQPVPGMPGSTLFLPYSGTYQFCANTRGQVAFIAAAIPSFTELLLATDLKGDLVTVYRSTDAVVVRPGVLAAFSSLGPLSISGGSDGRPRSMNAAGQIALQCYAYIPPGQPAGYCVVVFTVPGCYANCDGSTSPPILNVLDFGCFLNKFAAGDSHANCDGSTTPPVLNVLDFSCFVNRFAAGCS